MPLMFKRYIIIGPLPYLNPPSSSIHTSKWWTKPTLTQSTMSFVFRAYWLGIFFCSCFSLWLFGIFMANSYCCSVIFNHVCVILTNIFVAFGFLLMFHFFTTPHTSLPHGQDGPCSLYYLRFVCYPLAFGPLRIHTHTYSGEFNLQRKTNIHVRIPLAARMQFDFFSLCHILTLKRF